MDWLWTFFSEQLAQNQFLSGGALLAGFGIALAYLRRVPQQIYSWGKRRLVIRVDILDRDEAFGWMLAWLAQHPYKHRCRLISINTSNAESKGSKKHVIFSPAPGPHFFFYKRRLVILRRSRQEGGDLKGGLLGIQEKFDITIFSRNTLLVHELLDEAQEIANPKDKNIIKIYRSNWNEWVLARKQPIRRLNSIILDNNAEEKLLKDIKEFQESEDWYLTTGVPYRRGYLLHGHPGNGKSSIVTALASELKLNVCVLSLSSKGMNDEILLDLCLEIPPNSLMLIEDIDCAYTNRDTEERVTLSGLLNALDGIVATDGRIMFMTTNHRDELDDALIRPGRCDVTMIFNNATQTQAEKLFLHFYPEYLEKAKTFGEQGQGSSMAHLQGLLIEGKSNPENIQCIN